MLTVALPLAGLLIILIDVAELGPSGPNESLAVTEILMGVLAGVVTVSEVGWGTGIWVNVTVPEPLYTRA